ncbi:aldehyde dehydrogenase family protein [Trebonia kvetii]|uniref:Aldehyde dehydrogenase family protein n=1 Tax=Trebonia kvetii TaxID=2480626 RepID=A0A6P2BZ08_9ACTN|nr:aldehyde dehydrogenase family protein [Trebonia kvetii]TVZ04352.1 aldehyde dehydrogenase family protein [Trebonia kvetii]
MLEVRDPADVRSVVAEVPAMTATEVAAAYTSARAAFETWRRVNPLDRAALLSRAAALIRERTDEGAVIVVRENGKTLAEARVEVTKTADFLDYYASFARQPWGELLADARPGTSTHVRVEPVGVVLAICPWNDPLITPARKLGPALIAGNAVVLKAASQTPGIAIWAARQLGEAGLPDGVVQVITGRNSEISAALLASPDAVTFTGSNEVGAHLRRVLADRNVRLQAELGGKNVSVVLADADLDLAAATVASAAFAQAGQRCTATSRLIVGASVAAELTARLRDQVASIVVGPGLDAGTTMGPLSYAAHRDGVLEHIDGARKEGAEVIAGGGRPGGDALAHGCYVEPTLINVTTEQSLWREEVFGPVLAITTATGFDDAVRLANDTDYGLSAAVFTTSLTAANRFIELSETGQVSVNLPTAGWDVHHPFGGFRDSGSAFKEQGAPGIRFYTRIKTAAVRFAW